MVRGAIDSKDLDTASMLFARAVVPYFVAQGVEGCKTARAMYYKLDAAIQKSSGEDTKVRRQAMKAADAALKHGEGKLDEANSLYTSLLQGQSPLSAPFVAKICAGASDLAAQQGNAALAKQWRELGGQTKANAAQAFPERVFAQARGFALTQRPAEKYFHQFGAYKDHLSESIRTMLDKGDHARAAKLAGSIAPMYGMPGLHEEGQQLLAAVEPHLSQVSDPVAKSTALIGFAELRHALGMPDAVRMCRQGMVEIQGHPDERQRNDIQKLALTLTERIGGERELRLSQTALAELRASRGDSRSAEKYLGEAVCNTNDEAVLCQALAVAAKMALGETHPDDGIRLYECTKKRMEQAKISAEAMASDFKPLLQAAAIRLGTSRYVELQAQTQSNLGDAHLAALPKQALKHYLDDEDWSAAAGLAGKLALSYRGDLVAGRDFYNRTMPWLKKAEPASRGLAQIKFAQFRASVDPDKAGAIDLCKRSLEEMAKTKSKQSTKADRSWSEAKAESLALMQAVRGDIGLKRFQSWLAVEECRRGDHAAAHALLKEAVTGTDDEAVLCDALGASALIAFLQDDHRGGLQLYRCAQNRRAENGMLGGKLGAALGPHPQRVKDAEAKLRFEIKQQIKSELGRVRVATEPGKEFSHDDWQGLSESERTLELGRGVFAREKISAETYAERLAAQYDPIAAHRDLGDLAIASMKERRE